MRDHSPITGPHPFVIMQANPLEAQEQQLFDEFWAHQKAAIQEYERKHNIDVHHLRACWEQSMGEMRSQQEAIVV